MYLLLNILSNREMISTLISHNSPTTISFFPPTNFQPKQNKTKKKNIYYQPRQLVVGLL
jgi:hypothetical protein